MCRYPATLIFLGCMIPGPSFSAAEDHTAYAGRARWAINPQAFTSPGGVNTISLKGTLVEAVDIGADPGAQPLPPVVVKAADKTETITFRRAQDVLKGEGLTLRTIANGDSTWDLIVSTVQWVDRSPASIPIRGLQPGRRYQIELFLFDDRPGIGGREQGYSCSNVDYSPRVRWDGGRSVLGTFHAQTTTQAIEIESDYPALSAYVLRDVTGLADELADAMAQATAVLDLSKLRIPDLTPKASFGGVNPKGERIAVNPQYISRNGKPWIMVAGEIHPTRYPAEYWEEQLLKMKAGGSNAISAYVFWGAHEEVEGSWNWNGCRDIRRFVELCAKHDLPIFLRAGPHCNADYINGGLPSYLKEKGVKFRTNDPVYLDYVRKYFNQLGQQLKGLTYKDGGPIVALQVENEFEHAPTSWGFPGEGGKEHMRLLKKIAIEAGLDAPVHICTAWGSPVPAGEMIPGLGGYAFMGQGKPSRYFNFYDMATAKRQNFEADQYPVANIEIGLGMCNHGKWRPNSPPESAEAITSVMIGNGTNIVGYYMYQGVTHFVGVNGMHGRGDFLSYDWHCPLREFGNHRPSYDAMKPVNFFLSDYGDVLAPMVTAISRDSGTTATDTRRLRFAARAMGDSGFLFINNYQDRVQLPDRHDISIMLKFKDREERLPRLGGFSVKSGQSVILPFNLDFEGVRLGYAMAQLYTRTTTADGTSVYVFFVPEGLDGSYAFMSNSLKSVRGTPTRVDQENGLTLVKPEPGTLSLVTIEAKTGKIFHLLTLTRAQALTTTRQDIFGRQRLVLSKNLTISAEGELRVSQIGVANLSFSVFPAPDNALVATAGTMTSSQDGIFTRYTVVLPETKPVVSISGLGSAQATICAKPIALDGINDLFLMIDYHGDNGVITQNGKRICDDLYDGTVWPVGLKRFRPQLAAGALTLTVADVEPIVTIVNNHEVNSGVGAIANGVGENLPGNYNDTSAAGTKKRKEGVISAVQVLPEYAVWISTKNVE